MSERDVLREAAEKVVSEMQDYFDTETRDSEYNMAPYPNPVQALLDFAKLAKELA